ncbi:hypothetical protein ABIB82_002580 [Bradyrhizobium sp. i1.8.4]
MGSTLPDWLRGVTTARVVTFCAVILMAALFLYGLVRFPDAPLHMCASGYCGKQGRPHTLAEYSDFKAWERTLMICWPIGLIALYFLQRWTRGTK